MSNGIICRQQGCTAYAFYRYTWPGQNESAICPAHADRLLGIAGAIGLHVQLIELTPDERANESHPLAVKP
jgi:hypothetical protein